MAVLYSSHLLSASSHLQLSTKMALKTPTPLFPGFKAGSSQRFKECGCSFGFKSYRLVQNPVKNISCAMNMAAGQSDNPEKTKLEQVMDKARKLWDSSHQPVKSFPWIRELDNFIQLILDLVLAVVKYLSVPLLVVTPLSEMSYCAHERKLSLVLFPFFLGTAVSGVLKWRALDISPLLKAHTTLTGGAYSSEISPTGENFGPFGLLFYGTEDPKRHQEQHCHMIQRISLNPCRQNTNRSIILLRELRAKLCRILI